MGVLGGYPHLCAPTAKAVDTEISQVWLIWTRSRYNKKINSQRVIIFKLKLQDNDAEDMLLIGSINPMFKYVILFIDRLKLSLSKYETFLKRQSQIAQT